jgi:hypothetical protein
LVSVPTFITLALVLYTKPSLANLSRTAIPSSVSSVSITRGSSLCAKKNSLYATQPAPFQVLSPLSTLLRRYERYGRSSSSVRILYSTHSSPPGCLSLTQ